MTGYPLLDIFLTTLYVFGWMLWLILMFWIVLDIFRSPDLSGWAKAGWLLFVIALPLLGVLIYLIARGSAMHERSITPRAAADAPIGDYYPGSPESAGVARSPSDELSRLASLHQRGVINDEEFERVKMRVM
jgi:hypothetical protein